MRHVSKLLLVVPVCALLASAAVAGETTASTLGKKVDGYSLQDFRGKAHSLADLKDSKLVVVAFVGVECPLSKLYGPRLAEMAKAYESKGVAFVAVDSNRQDAVTEMAQYAKTHQIEFPFLKDLNNVLADQMGAQRNPQVFVLDADRKIRYSGRIDDQYGIQAGSGYAKFEIKNTDLSNALDQLLEGKDVKVASTDARGCLIGRVLKSDASGDVTYSKHIARIMQNHCVECHRPGQIGPFSLENYDDVAGWAEMIDEVVKDQRMPPWHPDPKFGHFRNDLSLAQADKELISKWVDEGAPEGDPKDLPEPKKFAGEWMMPGGPDAVFYMSEEPVDVPAEGTVDYRYYVVDPGFKEDKWVRVAECMPDNRGVVHHVIVFLKPPNVSLFSDDDDEGEKKDAADGKDKTAANEKRLNISEDGEEHEKDNAGSRAARRRRARGGGQASFGQLCGFAPGTRPNPFPENMAKLIPAGSQLVFQMHYTPNGSPQKDRSKVGIQFVKDPSKIKYRVATANAANGLFEIPAGDANYLVESDRTYGGDVLMLSVFPHMHLRGKDFRYDLTYPDGKTETILNMPRYDFNWQTSYVFTEPLKLPKGTKLHCTAHFDNSAENPANPDPSKPVRWGDQTWEEMMIGWFDIAVPVTANIAEVLPPQDRNFRRDDRRKQGEAGQ